MCLLTLRSTANKDGTIQQDDPAICKDGRQDFNIQQVPSIEEHEREAATSYIKTPCSIRKKLEAAINLDRSFNADAVWEEDFGELRATLESADDNLKTQMLHNQTNNLKEDHPKLEMEKDIMCLITETTTPYTDSDIEEGNMKMEVLNDNDWIYSPFTVGKENENLTSEEKIEIVFKDKSLTSEERITIAFKDENLTSEEKIKIVFKDANDRKTIETREEREKKEYIRQLFLMVLLFIILKNISGNIKCKQTSCQKYPCLNSILYLLWQSGDIEVNPGPANSTTYRNWLYEMCSIVRKAIAGVPAGCKIWKMEPKSWPPGVEYSDPRNTKGLDVNKVEEFLLILIKCCDTNNLSQEIKSEIDTWNSHRSKDNGELLHLCRMRECLKLTEQVNRSLKVLQNHLLPDKNLTVEVNPCIRLSFSCQPAIHQQLTTHTIYRSEATRKIASFLWKILHGKDPEKKCDNIWTKPDWWPLNISFYNPNNGGKRCPEKEDAMLVEIIITKCKDNGIKLQKPYKGIVEAWLDDDQMLLSKLMTRQIAEADLKKAVMKLHEEGLLQEVDPHLRELGLKVQYDGSTQNPKLQKRKMVNTMNKHETKRTKQSDHEDAVEATLEELLPDCSIGQLLDNESDSFLEEKIVQNIPDLLGDEADDIHVLWNQ